MVVVDYYDPTIDFIYLIVVVLGLLTLKYFAVPHANVVMAITIIVTTLTLIFSGGNDKISRKTKMHSWIKYILIGFIVGTIADLLMNFLVNLFKTKGNKNTNINNMIIYFNQTGTINSSFFAGLITSLMVLNVIVFASILDLPDTLLNLTLLGFVIGVLWGVVVEVWNVKAAKKLMVFYNNTKGGFMENRIWDGLSIALAAGVTKAIVK